MGIYRTLGSLVPDSFTPTVDLFPSLYIYNEVSELVFEMLEGSGHFCALPLCFWKTHSSGPFLDKMNQKLSAPTNVQIHSIRERKQVGNTV